MMLASFFFHACRGIQFWHEPPMNTRAFQPMRRVAVRTMLFLLLGAIVNLMVAWGLAVFFPIHVAVTHQGVFSTAPTDPIQWQNAVIPQFGALGIDAEVWRYHR